MQFQPDDEEEEDNAELSDMPDLFDIGEHRKPKGANRSACREIAEDGPKAEAFEQRNRDHGRAKIKRSVDQKRIGSGGGIGQGGSSNANAHHYGLIAF